MGSWWPTDHHILEGELAEMVFEPRVGGNIYDRAVDGKECRWARVLAYEPPDRLVFSWDISNQWQVETDPAKTSEVEVTFVADGPRRTNVVLEHRNLDRHGEGWESHRDAVGSPTGWQVGETSLLRRRPPEVSDSAAMAAGCHGRRPSLGRWSAPLTAAADCTRARAGAQRGDRRVPWGR